jgi:hypothetical protein
MRTNPSHSLDLHHGGAAALSHPGDEALTAPTPAALAARAASRQRTGKRMIVAGFVITIIGVVLYCAASFGGDLGADMGDVLFRNAVPFARATLAVLGLGTLVWLAGSFIYLEGTMDAEQGDEGGGPA